jgi:hypothetical protein
MVGFIWRTSVNSLRRPFFQALAVAILAAGGGHAQVPTRTGQVWTPESSIEKPGDTGVRAHTNIQIFIPDRGPKGTPKPSGNGRPGVAGRPPQTPPTNGPSAPAQPQ